MCAAVAWAYRLSAVPSYTVLSNAPNTLHARFLMYLCCLITLLCQQFPSCHVQCTALHACHALTMVREWPLTEWFSLATRPRDVEGPCFKVLHRLYCFLELCWSAVSAVDLAGDDFSRQVLSAYNSLNVQVDFSIDNRAWYPDLGNVAATNYNRMKNILSSAGHQVVCSKLAAITGVHLTAPCCAWLVHYFNKLADMHCKMFGICSCLVSWPMRVGCLAARTEVWTDWLCDCVQVAWLCWQYTLTFEARITLGHMPIPEYRSYLVKLKVCHLSSSCHVACKFDADCCDPAKCGLWW